MVRIGLVVVGVVAAALFLLFASVSALSPQTASAATAAELQQQTLDLQNRVTQLQQQQGGSKSAVTATPVPAPAPRGCPVAGATLQRGSSGTAVTRLQQFLAGDPTVYPEGIVNGSYGALTEAAVKRWQVKFNIVSSGTAATTGYGAAGATTIAAMIAQCPGSPQVAVSVAPALGGYMSVTPIAGVAQLLVTLQVTVNTANVCGTSTYNIDFGDGAQYQLPVPASACQQVTQKLVHIYQNPGSFPITLSNGLHRTLVTVTVAPR